MSANGLKDSDVSGAEWNHSSEGLPDLQVASGMQRGKVSLLFTHIHRNGFISTWGSCVTSFRS